MATVNVVKGSADEAILRAQYGDAVKFNYTNANQFAGADRTATNQLYQGILGKPTNNAGDLNNYGGIKLQAGGSLSDGQIQANQNTANQEAYKKSLTDMATQLAQAQAASKLSGLKSAYESNTQGLNSQNSQVNNAYTKATNSINATRDAQLPQYQQQRDAASADAAATARKVRELMAATGRYNSGTNRSEQLAVDLNRSNAIQGLNQSQNDFTTQIGNQLSEADNNKAAAISDIAQRLQLLQKQFNDGTLDINNTMASDTAIGAEKAFLTAQDWADTQNQRGIENSDRKAQLDQAEKTAESIRIFNEKKFNNDNVQWDKTFEQNNTNDILNRQMANNKIYAPKTIPQSSPTGKTNMDDAIISVQEALRVSSPGNVAADIEGKRDSLKKQGINVDTLIKEVWRLSGVQTKPEAEDSWR